MENVGSWKVAAMAASDRLRVDSEALAASAAHVAGQGEDLATAHLSSDNRFAAAQSGWVGNSAAALQERTSAWLETSRALLSRVGEQALNLSNDAIHFAATERLNAERMRAVVGDQPL